VTVPPDLDMRYPHCTVPVFFADGREPAELERAVIRPLAPDRIALVSDANVFARHGYALEALLAQAGHVVATVVLQPGEETKSPEVAAEVAGAFCENGLSRRSLVLALGGGVVGDLAGFVAGIYMRGIRYVQVPTSLLAQVDSAVGGKVGVNLHDAKNMLGLFYQPAAIWVDTRYLATLPEAEYHGAFGEVLKYALTLDATLYERLAALPAVAAVRGDAAFNAELVRRCVARKAEVAAADETERGLRRVLNFGHTAGHALEAAGEYRRFRHGEAVAVGMVVAQELGRRLGCVDAAWAEASIACIRRLLPAPALDGLDAGALLAAMTHDKKWSGSRRCFVFSTGPGRHRIEDDVPAEAVAAALRHVLAADPAASAWV